MTGAIAIIIIVGLIEFIVYTRIQENNRKEHEEAQRLRGISLSGTDCPRLGSEVSDDLLVQDSCLDGRRRRCGGRGDS